MGQNINEQFLDTENARVLADLLADPDTQESVRIAVIKKLLSSIHSDNFFQTIKDQKLDYGACPNCGHENHWLIPEVELNKMGYVTHEVDTRVSQFTTEKSCPKWQQACHKRKLSV